jgi:hypothetical protein
MRPCTFGIPSGGKSSIMLVLLICGHLMPDAVALSGVQVCTALAPEQILEQCYAMLILPNAVGQWD